MTEQAQVTTTNMTTATTTTNDTTVIEVEKTHVVMDVAPQEKVLYDTDVEAIKSLKHEESVLDRHTDPFATREGKALVWKNVNMILVSNK
jgi:hypothetical protein